MGMKNKIQYNSERVGYWWKPEGSDAWKTEIINFKEKISGTEYWETEAEAKAYATKFAKGAPTQVKNSKLRLANYDIPSDHWVSLQKEDAPANNVGSGEIAGTGHDGENPVVPVDAAKKYKKKNTEEEETVNGRKLMTFEEFVVEASNDADEKIVFIQTDSGNGYTNATIDVEKENGKWVPKDRWGDVGVIIGDKFEIATILHGIGNLKQGFNKVPYYFNGKSLIAFVDLRNK